eukprot:TRINITY_DN27504_c0_g2_i1.p1 TRINITY_DN27504_c0_g2~~TRINITY_DN27504_c0_g2_i1.p1  ORF type:complete len:846 (-),score=100.67 TRINITY_DN27504_c0_g2_i1:90-2627(-)
MTYPLTRFVYWYIKKSAAGNGDCYRTWLLKEFILFSYTGVGAEVADRYGWEIPAEPVVDIIKDKLQEMRCLNSETQQQIFVANYQPPRFRRCPRGQIIQPNETGLGIFAHKGCGDCPAGTYQPRHMEVTFLCNLCDTGMFNSLEKQSVCSSCPAGTFSDTPGSKTCAPCPSGRYSPSFGAAFCFSCPVGTSTQNETGAMLCQQCPKGKFGDEVFLPFCRDCPGGLTTAQSGSNNSEACGCEASFFSDENCRCRRCPNGFECRGFGQPFHAQPGHMIFLADSSTQSETVIDQKLKQLYKCQPSNACPGGPPGTCNGGRIGIACGLCPDHFYLRDGQCQRCGDPSLATLCLVTWIAFIILFPVGHLYLSKDGNPEMDAERFLAKVSIAGVAIIGVRSMQLFGLLSLLTIAWPNNVGTYLMHFEFFLLNPEMLPNLRCIMRSPLQIFVVVALSLPLALLVLGVCLGIRAIVYGLGRQFLKVPEHANTAGTLLHLGFASITTTALAPMMCYEHPSGSKSMIQHPSIVCGDADHSVMLVIGLFLLLLATLFLSVVVFITWRAPAASSDVVNRRTFLRSSMFLLKTYRPDRWFWGLLSLPRSLLMPLVPVLMPNVARDQILSFAVIMIVYMVVQIRQWPWRVPILNVLDLGVSVLMLVVLLTVAVAFVPTVATDAGNNDATGFYDVVVISSSVLTLILIGVSLIVTMAVWWITKYRGSDAFYGFSKVLYGLSLPLMEDVSKCLERVADSIAKLQPTVLMKILSDMEVYDRCFVATATALLLSNVSTEVISDTCFEDVMSAWGQSRRVDMSVQPVDDVSLTSLTSVTPILAETNEICVEASVPGCVDAKSCP